MSVIAITDSDLGDGSIERSILGKHELRVGNSMALEDIIMLAADAQGMFVQWARVDDAMLARLPKLKIIVRYGIGLDNVDLAAARERGIRVENVPDYCIDEVVAHAIAFIVARARRLVDYSENTQSGQWTVAGVLAPRAPVDDPVGVAGVGRIGRLVATRAAALGHPVIGWDPYASSWPDGVARVKTLPELAQRVNHLSLHIPLQLETRGIVGTEVLREIGGEGHLVNTSRGGLVDEAALLNALNSGSLGFASLDVLATEPPTGTSSTLIAHPRTLVTPHAAYCSDSARTRLQVRAAEIMAELIEGLC